MTHGTNRVEGSTKRQAMFRLMVANPKLLRSVYERVIVDQPDLGSFEEWEDYAWEQARGRG